MSCRIFATVMRQKLQTPTCRAAMGLNVTNCEGYLQFKEALCLRFRICPSCLARTKPALQGSGF